VSDNYEEDCSDETEAAPLEGEVMENNNDITILQALRKTAAGEGYIEVDQGAAQRLLRYMDKGATFKESL
jgi:predicted ribosome-associated RNA-binding protein Tma20